jgi:PAS domain S-box-containing protein
MKDERAWSNLIALVPTLLLVLLGTASGQAQERAAAPKVVVYGGLDNFAPYEYLDGSGKPQGFNVQLVRTLAKVAGHEVEFRLLDRHQLREEWDAGRIDLQSRIFSEMRGRDYDYLAQLWTIRVVVAFLPGRARSPAGIEELAGETVAIQSDFVVAEQLETLPPEKRPVLRTEDDQRLAVELLQRREVTAVVGNYLTLVRFARELGLPDLVERPLRTYSYHLVTRRGRGGEFAWTFNAMARVESDGIRDGLVEAHLSLPPAPWSWRNVLPVAGGLFGVVAAGGMLVFLWNRALRREVAARTEELGSSLLEKEALARYLHLTTETLQAFIQSSPLAIISLDPEGIVRNWNARAEQLFGWTADEVVGRPLPYRVEKGREEVAVLMERVLAGESLQGVEILRHRKDGTPVHAAVWAASLLNEAGETAEVVAFVADTTREKRLAEQLQQSQKMEAVGRLAGGIAHDFNNVLTAITGYCELALRRVRPDEPVRRHLEGIRAAADKATAFTRQVLSFSRKQKTTPRHVDLDDVAASVVSMLRPVIGEDIRVAHARSATLWPVRADPGQLQQVLLNLAVNARDAMPEGGELTIETANVTLPDSHSLGATGPHVMVAVRDSGVGMDDDVRSHLFEPFFTTKEPGRGTGLGLATVHGIVNQSEGHLVVESAPGRGSTFRVYLPRAGEQKPRPVAPVVEGAPGGSETVLLVEDDDAVRHLNLEVLRAAGYVALEARHAGEALIIAERHSGAIHLLITDVVMPHMSGLELVERMSVVRPGVRVLLVSGYADDAVLRHGRGAENWPFLQKPFPPDALLRKAREVLDATAAA